MVLPERDEDHGVERKQVVDKPKRFTLKVAASGPPRAKGKASPEHSRLQTFTASRGGKRAGEAPNTSPPLSECG